MRVTDTSFDIRWDDAFQNILKLGDRSPPMLSSVIQEVLYDTRRIGHVRTGFARTGAFWFALQQS